MAGAPAGAGSQPDSPSSLSLIWLGYEIYSNAQANLQAQRIATGFGFLQQRAGFGISQTLIPYQESDSYTRVFLSDC